MLYQVVVAKKKKKKKQGRTTTKHTWAQFYTLLHWSHIHIHNTTTQHITTQYKTTQYNTIQDNTIQHNIFFCTHLLSSPFLVLMAVNLTPPNEVETDLPFTVMAARLIHCLSENEVALRLASTLMTAEVMRDDAEVLVD